MITALSSNRIEHHQLFILTKTFGVGVVTSTALCALFASKAVQARTFACGIANGRHTAVIGAVAWLTVRVVVVTGNALQIGIKLRI